MIINKIEYRENNYLYKKGGLDGEISRHEGILIDGWYT